MNGYTMQSKGAALVTSLVLLMALTMISLSAIQTSAVQMQISGNDQVTLEAAQYAQSVVDAVVETPTNFVVGASSGYTLCAANASGCDQVGIPLTDAMFTSVQGGINATTGVQARVQLLKTGTAPRLGAKASSATAFSGAYFAITGSYDERKYDGGKSDVVQGFVMIYPKN